MKAYGRRLKVRGFIEGVEFPVISAQIRVVPNSPMVCSIQVPPVSEGMRLHPRSLIHLYYLSDDPITPAVSSLDVGKTPSTYERQLQRWGVDRIVEDSALDQYKLVFVGELVGVQWTKNTQQRSLVFQCLDLSNYWDYAYQWSNHDLFGPGVKALFAGGGTNLFSDLLDDDSSVIMRLIQTPSVQYPALEGLLGNLIHLLESIGGSYYAEDKVVVTTKTSKSKDKMTGKVKTKKTPVKQRTRFAGQNIFFSLAELRLHILQMITAFPSDNTAKKLLGYGGFDGLMGRQLGQLGAQVSIRQALNALMGIIFHETYAQPCPMFVPGIGGDNSGRVTVKLSEEPRYKTFVIDLEGIQTSLAKSKGALTVLSGESGAEFKKDKKELSVALSAAKTALTSLTNHARAIGADEAASALASAGKSLGKAYKELTVAAPNNFHATGAAAAIDDVLSSIGEAIDSEVTTTRKTAVPSRLNQQIFRPDVWFTAPPRCNVIFPDQYHTFQYERVFMKEPTRLLLRTSQEFFGEDDLFDNLYFAPKVFTAKGAKKTLSGTLSKDLMLHEVYTGILPVFEKMGEFNIYAVRSQSKDPTMKKVGLAQRSCNFLYFKHRFAARQLSLVGRFMPQLACGFPSLIIDRYIPMDRLTTYAEQLKQKGRTRSVNSLLGTHFLCDLAEVTHVLSQNDGTTSILGTYARQVDESIEFLGSTDKDVFFDAENVGSSLNTYEVARLTLPPPGSKGKKGFVVRATDITASRKGKDLKLSGAEHVTVTVGELKPIKDYGPTAMAAVHMDNTPDVPVTFLAVRVEEEEANYAKKNTEVPAEEYIRPGWYGNVWQSKNIGAAYYHFFGTGAISEATQEGLPEGFSANFYGNEPGFQPPELGENATIEQAAYFLVYLYSFIKSAGLDIHQFINTYTWRPIASMVDMFGTSDLAIDPITFEVTQGMEGFHSRAFGPIGKLFGLAPPSVRDILGVSPGDAAADRLDTRPKKYEAALDFVTALQLTKAVIA